MEDTLLQSVSIFASYGALGVCTLYFMWKDSTVNKELTQALKEFTVAINLLSNKK